MPTAVATVAGSDGNRFCWKNNGIELVVVPVDLFAFLFALLVKGVASMIMLVEAFSGSCFGQRKAEAALGFNAKVITSVFIDWQ